MFKAARNDYRVYSIKKSQGIALLVILALILVAFTSIAISRLSQSSGEQKAKAKTTQALKQSKDAIMAFTLAQDPATTRPGTLPCPDTDGDGRANTATPCPQRGLVPFVDLAIPQPLDGAGAPLWYAVSREYTNNPALLNSSLVSNLQINAQPAAFILFAPNVPVGGQNRPLSVANQNPSAATFALYLEGANANPATTPNDYTDLYNPTQNDQVLSVLVDEFWTNVEGVVLREIGRLITNYHAQCNVYPWPALYTSFGNNDSDTSPITLVAFEGRVPLGTAQPSDWGSPCPAPATGNTPIRAPNWIANNWGDLIYYAICRSPTGAPRNPPLSRCLQLGSGNVAEAILIGPGAVRSGQNRPSVNITDFFDGQNASVLDNTFNQVKFTDHTPSINDRIYVIH